MDPVGGSRLRVPAWRVVLQLSGRPAIFIGHRKKDSARAQHRGHAIHRPGAPRRGVLGDRAFQRRVFWPAVVVHAGDGSSDRFVSAPGRGLNCGTGGIWRSDGRNRFRATRRLLAGSRPGIWLRFFPCGYSARHCLCGDPRDYTGLPNWTDRTENDFSGSSMKIKEIRTRVFRWRGKTVRLPPHFCTNPMDVLQLTDATMGTFTFHEWLVVEIFTDDGLVGIGNAALAPQITKRTIDLHLKPLLIEQNPWDIEFLWQHM